MNKTNQSIINLPSGASIKITIEVIDSGKSAVVAKQAERIGQKQSVDPVLSKDDQVGELVKVLKNSESYDVFSERILEKASLVDRVILPLYIVKNDFNNSFSLSSNDIYKVLKELGVSIALPNISKTLKKSANKYIIPDKMTKKGQSTAYKISLTGEKYIKEILAD